MSLRIREDCHFKCRSTQFDKVISFEGIKGEEFISIYEVCTHCGNSRFISKSKLNNTPNP